MFKFSLFVVFLEIDYINPFLNGHQNTFNYNIKIN